MKGMLYLAGREEPVAVLDNVKILAFNDNHMVAPLRIYYQTLSLNSGRVMLELQRDERMVLKLDDGRSANVLLQHESMDSEGYSVGVLRVLGPMVDPALAAVEAPAAGALVAGAPAAAAPVAPESAA